MTPYEATKFKGLCLVSINSDGQAFGCFPFLLKFMGVTIELSQLHHVLGLHLHHQWALESCKCSKPIYNLFPWPKCSWRKSLFCLPNHISPIFQIGFSSEHWPYGEVDKNKNSGPRNIWTGNLQYWASYFCEKNGPYRKETILASCFSLSLSLSLSCKLFSCNYSIYLGKVDHSVAAVE